MGMIKTKIDLHSSLEKAHAVLGHVLQGKVSAEISNWAHVRVYVDGAEMGYGIRYIHGDLDFVTLWSEWGAGSIIVRWGIGRWFDDNTLAVLPAYEEAVNVQLFRDAPSAARFILNKLEEFALYAPNDGKLLKEMVA